MAYDNGVLVYIEKDEESPSEVSLEALSHARQLSEQGLGKCSAVLVEPTTKDFIATVADYCADEVYVIAIPLFSAPPAEILAEALCRLLKEKEPSVLLIGATIRGNDLGARIAAQMKTALVTDCTGLALTQEGLLTQTKLIYGGKVEATFKCHSSSVTICTLKPGFIEKERIKLQNEPNIVQVCCDISKEHQKIIEISIVRADPEKVELDEAEVVLAGGRGIASTEGFGVLKSLAKAMGGVIGASLGAVDEEIAPRKLLVGQTGKTIAPRLYVACGISGSIYHVLGMKDSEIVVAINKDRSAPIFRYADLGLVGDGMEILPAIARRINKNSSALFEGHINDVDKDLKTL